MPPRPRRRTRYWLGRSTHAWRRDLHEGVILALLVAAFYSVVTIVYYLVAGEVPFGELGISLAEALAAYCLGGLLSGIAYGILKPLARTTLSALFVGILIATPVFASFGFVSDDPIGWPVAAAMTVFFGLIAGVSMSQTRAIDREFDETAERYDRLMAGELSDEEIQAIEREYRADLERRKAARRSRTTT
jgi:hypothetical protein